MLFRIRLLLMVAAVAVAIPHSAHAQASLVKSIASPASPTPRCGGPTQAYVLTMLRDSGWVDLRSRADREITGACLDSLVNSGSKGRPVEIIGARVKDGFDVNFAEVNVAVILRATTFAGMVRFENSRFRWNVVLDSSTFEGPVDFRGTTFEAALSLNGAEFRAGLNGFHARVGGDFEAMGTIFRGDVDFRGLAVKGDARFDSITAGRFDASRGAYEGDVVFTNSWFVGPDAIVNLERATIKQTLFLNSLDTVAPLVNLVYTDVGYSLGANGTVWGDSVKMRGMRTGMHLDLRHGRFEDPLILRGAQVRGDLLLDSVVVTQGAELDRASVTGTLSLRGSEFGGSLSLAEVDAGLLNITGVRRLPPPAAFSVDGLTFGHMESVVNGQSSPSALLAFLGSARFSADAYGTLEGFFARHGEKRFANRTLYERRARERGGLPVLSRIGSILLNVTVRYGRLPALAFLWWALFVGLGMWVFSRAQLTLADPEKACCQRFDPLWYSLDTFLPMVDLKYADEWKLTRENNRWPWLYLRFHTLMGWVLIPVALAAISGLLK
ncbi:MAG TPA: pentapeptide repeat-containing protein [Longimicrobium sp.]|nr:pentapeptide repeat-containing protein [Longimicrobium sp.]